MPRRILRRILTSALATAIASGAALALSTPAQGAPQTPLFGPSIDQYAANDPQDTCDIDAKPGVVAFKDMLNAEYGSHSYGIGRACTSGGTSEHKEGRALDYMLDYNNSAQRADAQDILNWLLATDRHGNQHANARRLGIMYLIWNRQIWSASRHAEGWRSYSCDGTASGCHTNHIHFSFSWAGALKQTTWWGGVGGGSVESPILAYDSGTATVMYRWGSNGSSFNTYSTATHSSFDMDNVGDRVAAGDVNGDGKDDTVMAHQNADGTFTFKVLLHGTVAPVNWYTSGPFNLSPVGDRLIVGDVNGDGKAEPILGYDNGTSVILYRWYSTGASFSSLSTATYDSFDLDNVGSRMAAGDVDGDGSDDTVMAYQNANGSFTYKVFLHGTIAPVNWYTSGPFNLSPVGNRLVLGNWL